jgi:quercetin dioxygenase-like cupin family protein
MNSYILSNMVKGWFVGGFSPAVLQSSEFEVAIKKYKLGEIEPLHFHQIATEITVVISGNIVMCEKSWSEGDIIVLHPGEATSFMALSDAVTVVVKTPSVPDDKYLV